MCLLFNKHSVFSLFGHIMEYLVWPNIEIFNLKIKKFANVLTKFTVFESLSMQSKYRSTRSSHVPFGTGPTSD